MGKFCIVISLWIISLFGANVTYRWPIPNATKNVNSTFCDYRPTGTRYHFHEGTDIPSIFAVDVRTITTNFQLMSLPDSGGDGWIVYVRHYTDDTYPASLFEGSRYIHMYKKNDSLAQTDTVYSNVYVAHNTNFKENHLHLEYQPKRR